MQTQNMGPFNPVNFRGSGKAQAIPIFTKELPIRLGGLAGPNAHFGKVVSVDLTDPRRFIPGWVTGQLVRGILVADPNIMANDPAMNDLYYEGRPASIVVLGAIELMKYDLTQAAPTLTSKVWFKNTTGEIAFTPAATAVLAGYTLLNASVLDVDVPNGVSIWIHYPVVATTAAVINPPNVANPAVVNAPVASDGTGAELTPYEVSDGTIVTASSATPGATLYYTLDGSDPSMDSEQFPVDGIIISASVTLKIVAAKDGMDPSAVVSVFYTVA